MALKHYTPTKVFDDLNECLANGESFVTATDDHRYASFVDWVESDDDARAEMFEVAGWSHEDQEREFVRQCEEVISEYGIDHWNGHLAADLETIANWHGPAKQQGVTDEAVARYRQQYPLGEDSSGIESDPKCTRCSHSRGMHEIRVSDRPFGYCVHVECDCTAYAGRDE